MSIFYSGIQFLALECISGKITIDEHVSSAAIPVGSSLEFLKEENNEFFFKVTQPNGLTYEVSLNKDELFSNVKRRSISLKQEGDVIFSLVFAHAQSRYFFENEWARVTFNNNRDFVGIVYQDGGFCQHISHQNWGTILNLVFLKEIEIY